MLLHHSAQSSTRLETQAGRVALVILTRCNFLQVRLVLRSESPYPSVTLSEAKGLLIPMRCFAEFTLNATRDSSLRSE
jgi:hypothetical protein